MKRHVTLKDELSDTFVRIPTCEFAPGMVPWWLLGRNETVWRHAESIPRVNGHYHHPPFDGEKRSIIESLGDAFPGILEGSYETSECHLQKNTHPLWKGSRWLVTARLFCEFAEGWAMAYGRRSFISSGSA